MNSTCITALDRLSDSRKIVRRVVSEKAAFQERQRRINLNAGRGFCCRLGRSAAAGSDPQTFPGLADGSHSLSVRAVELAGNADASPATRVWNVDTLAPNTMYFVVLSDARFSVTNSVLFFQNQYFNFGKINRLR